MPRYIDADKLIKTIRDNDYLVVDYFNSKDRGMFTAGIMQAIDEQPSADVRENRHGNWINDGQYQYRCSNCGEHIYGDADATPDINKFCWNCGADMRTEVGK